MEGFKKIEFANIIWDTLQERFGVTSPTRLIHNFFFEKLKCEPSQKMMNHHCILSGLCADLEAAGHSYANENIGLTMVRLKPEDKG